MMQRKKIIRALRYAIIAVIIFTVILFPLSVYLLINGLSSAISDNGNDGAGLKLNKDNPNGDWTLTFNSNPKNTSPISEKVTYSIGLIDPNGKYITVNSTAVDIAPGEHKPLSITLTIPYTEVQKYNLNSTQDAPVIFELKFGISTLWNIVSFAQTMKIAGNYTQ
jgi:hypothetical protein